MQDHLNRAAALLAAWKTRWLSLSEEMRASLIGGAALLTVFAGLFVFHIGNSPSGPEAALSENGALNPDGTPAPIPAPGSEFAFRRLEIDTSKPQAEACLVFTRALDASGNTHYEDYLSATPAARMVVRPNGERLCIGGLAFNATYSVQLKPGLPDAAGAKIDPGETVQVELRDRPPLVRFAGGILLPRENAEGVPVTTVNVSKVKLKVVRVGDRLLSQLQTGLLDETSLYLYDERRLSEDQGALIWTGEMDVTLSRNEIVTTLFPIRDVLKPNTPGAYMILASDANSPEPENEYSVQLAAQWVIDSDIGLTSFTGGQGDVSRSQSRQGRSATSRVRFNRPRR